MSEIGWKDGSTDTLLNRGMLIFRCSRVSLLVKRVEGVGWVPPTVSVDEPLTLETRPLR